jgi:hypothetical protein
MNEAAVEVFEESAPCECFLAREPRDSVWGTVKAVEAPMHTYTTAASSVHSCIIKRAEQRASDERLKSSDQ